MHYHASQYYTSTACGGSRQAGRGTSGFSIVSKRIYVAATVQYPPILEVPVSGHQRAKPPSLGCMIPGYSLNWRVGVVLI